MNFFSYLHQNINIPISSYLNSFTQNDLIARFVYFFADFPIFFLPIFLVGMWLYFAYKKDIDAKIKLLFVFYSTVYALVISLVIQHFFHIDRPIDYLENAGNFILNHIPDASFPSDHARISTAFLSALFLFGYKKLSYILTPLFIIMLISRIAGGVHWFFDIVFGVIVGLIGAFIVYKSRDLAIFKKINNGIITIASYIKL